MLRKIQLFQKIVAQNTGNYVPQNTDFYENCSAKYSKKLLRLHFANYKCCAKYNKPRRDYRIKMNEKKKRNNEARTGV